MEGPRYPAGAEVRAGDLRYGETTKARQILARFADIASGGVATGLTVTSEGVSGTFAIASGHGYTPRGDYIELPTGAAGQSIVSPAGDQTHNYVCVLYYESTQKPGASRLTGTASDRQTVGSSRLLVLTVDEYTALPSSSDILTQPARDRLLVCAIVRRASTSSAVLTVEIVEEPGPTQVVKSCTQPLAITGVIVAAIDENCPEGLATLTCQFNTPNVQLKWASPGAVAGPFQTATQGTLTLVDGNGLELVVVIDDTDTVLPLNANIAGPITDTLVVTQLYTNVVQLASASDHEHRAKTGGEIISAENVHGTRLEQILGVSLEQIRGMLEVGSQLLTHSNADIVTLFGNLPKLVHGASGATLVAGQKNCLYEHKGNNSTGSTRRLRVYWTSAGELWVTHNAKHFNEGVPSDATKTWTRDTAYGDAPTTASLLYRLGNDGTFSFYARSAAAADDWVDADWPTGGAGSGDVNVGGSVLVGNTVVASSSITAVTGNVSAASGNVSAGVNVTAGGDVAAGNDSTAVANMTAGGEFTWTAPKTFTRYYAANSLASNEEATGPYSVLPDALYFRLPDLAGGHVGLDLPQGAIIQNIKVHYRAWNAGNIIVTLYKTDFPLGSPITDTPLAGSTFAVAANNPNFTFLGSPGGLPATLSGAFAYFVRITNNLGGNLDYHGLQVEYTMSQVVL